MRTAKGNGMARKEKLTPKQLEYCRQRAKGKGYADAYFASGYSDKQGIKSATDNAYNMENNSVHSTEILQKIQALRDKADKGGILQRKERMQLLSDMATNENIKPQDRIRALDQLARMSADYTDRIQVEGKASVNLTYSERIEAIKQAMEAD